MAPGYCRRMKVITFYIPLGLWTAALLAGYLAFNGITVCPISSGCVISVPNFGYIDLTSWHIVAALVAAALVFSLIKKLILAGAIAMFAVAALAASGFTNDISLPGITGTPTWFNYP